MIEFVKALSSPSFADEWEKHKNDKVWRKFWALWELKKVWGWADKYYKILDRTDDEIVAPEWWSRESGGVGFLNLCLWLSFLRSVCEGIINGLDDNKTNIKTKRETTNQFEILHNKLGGWINKQFNLTVKVFIKKYNTPTFWIGVNTK